MIIPSLGSRKEKGFTLVELLVVIAIIGVLATLVLLQLGTARGRARDTKRIADVAQIRSAVEQYFEDNNGTYPADIDDATVGKYFSSGKVPTDPLTATKQYNYCVIGTNGYQVATELEQKAAALNADSDFTDASPCLPGAGPVGSNNETCSSSSITDNDCVYDVGTKS